MERTITYKYLRRSYFALYPIMMLAPIIGLILFIKGWWMFFACLFAYLIQLIICANIISYPKLDSKTITVDNLDKFVLKEKRIKNVHATLLGVIAILDLFPFFAMSFSLMFSLGLCPIYEGGIAVSIMVAFIVFFIVAAIFMINYSDIFNIKKSYDKTRLTPLEEQQERIKRQAQREIDRKKHEVELYGVGYSVISHMKKIYVNESEQLLFINKIGYNFKDILNYTVLDNSQTIHSGGSAITKTNTGSMLGRAAIGGVLLGNVGAVIGGSTGSKSIDFSTTYSTEIHNYKIIITINSISSPMLTIELGQDQDLMNKISTILTVIINRNKS